MSLHWTCASGSWTSCLIILQKPWNFRWAGNKPSSMLSSTQPTHYLQSFHHPIANGQEYQTLIYLSVLHFWKGLNSIELKIISSFLIRIGIGSAPIGRMGGMCISVQPHSHCVQQPMQNSYRQTAAEESQPQQSGGGWRGRSMPATQQQFRTEGLRRLGRSPNHSEVMISGLC